MHAPIIMLQILNKRHSGIQLVCCYNNRHDAGLNLPSGCNVFLLLLLIYGTSGDLTNKMCKQGKRPSVLATHHFSRNSDKCNSPSKMKFKHSTENKNTILKIYKLMNARYKSAQKVQ